MNDDLKSSPRLIDFVCGWEKFSAKPYRDQGGLWTWGCGHLQKKGEALPVRINEQEGARLMAIDLMAAEKAVRTGLTKRRAAEQRIFVEGVYDSTH